MTSEPVRLVIEKITELKTEIEKVTNGKLVPLQNLFRGTGVEYRNTWLLHNQLERISHYIDETDEDIRRIRIEPLIDDLENLYNLCKLSELSRMENNAVFNFLKKQTSSNLNSHGIDPIKALKVVILDLAVNPSIDYPEHQIRRWACDLLGAKSEWMVFAYLEGVVFENDFSVDYIHFTSNPNALVSGDERAVYPMSEPHAQLSLNQNPNNFPVFYAGSAREIYKIIYQISVCIELYTRKRLRILMTHLRPLFSPVRDHLHKHWILEEKLAAEYYTVTNDQHEKFAHFITEILPILNRLGIEEHRFGSDYRSIAIKHFCDAIHSYDPLEQISAAVVSLEALYGYESTELLYRLKQRIVRFIGPIMKNSDQVLSTVKSAYTTRSAYLHGEKPRNPNNSLLEMLITILIVSIVLVLKIDMSKKDFIEMLDEAMICNNKGKALSDWVSETYASLN